MTIRTVRDWRSIKHRLSESSNEDLASLLANAEQTAHEVTRFKHSVEAEVILREHVKTAEAPSALSGPRDDVALQFLQRLSGSR